MSSKVNNKEKLLARQERLREDKERVESKIRALQNQIKEADRKARTHRLCSRGGMLESFLPDPENITDDAVMDLLKKLFDLSAAKKLVSEAADQSSDHEAAFDFSESQNEKSSEVRTGSFEIEEFDDDE